MTQNIHELAKALRDAAEAIERRPKFTLEKDIDLESAVTILHAHVPKNENIYLKLNITIDGYGGEKTIAEWSVYESYKEVSKGATLEACMAGYLISKECPDSLASVARLVKAASKVEAETAPKEVEVM